MNMRANEILQEDEYVPIDGDKIENIIKSVFNKKYPDTMIFTNTDEWEDITNAVTSQETEDAMDPEYGDPEFDIDSVVSGGSQFFDPNPDEFSLTINAYVDKEANEMVVVVTDAGSGPYKGVVAPIIDEIFKTTPNLPRVLVIKHDSSGGVWEKIAKKLGAELQDDRYY